MLPPRLIGPDNVRLFAPLMIKGAKFPVILIELPIVRAPPEAKIAGSVPVPGETASAPVPSGPEVTVGLPVELMPNPRPPSTRVAPPE